jgi:hypothetical protein
MNTGQMLLAVGAMILLATIILRVNNSFMASDEVLDQSKYNFLATSIAISIIQEAKNLSFDEKTLDSLDVNYAHDLTPKNVLGDEDETRDQFDDFDDFHLWSDTVSTLPSAVFNVSCIVQYVDETDLTKPSANNTFNKMITVTVSSPFMPDVVTLSSVFSYWFFR